MTLAELITAMMISLIVGAAAISILLMAINLYTEYQIKNRQYVIIDYVENVISEEIRNAESVTISDASPFVGNTDTDTVTYNYITTTASGEVSKFNDSGEQDLCGASILLDNHTIRLVFTSNPNTADTSSVLYVEVYMDEGTEYAVTESFYVKVLNLERSGGAVEEASGASGSTIYYKLTSL